MLAIGTLPSNCSVFFHAVNADFTAPLALCASSTIHLRNAVSLGLVFISFIEGFPDGTTL
jgi:hypothetical protein